MKINRLQVERFRNLSALEWTPGPGVNRIVGRNAQGKTNLLEAIWLFTGGRSFRGNPDRELIRIGAAESKLQMDFFAQEREQSARIFLGNTRRVQLNDVPLNSAARLTGIFCAVIFSPLHLSIVKNGPSVRRKLMDVALCQSRPSYAVQLLTYNRVLLQRNTLLKDLTRHPSLADTLQVWDQKLAKTGAFLMLQRRRFMEKLGVGAAAYYQGMTAGRETLGVEYRPSVKVEAQAGEAEILEALLRTLEGGHKGDIQLGTTRMGPHRDEIQLSIEGLPCRSYGSQGQQRSAVLALKLAEAEIMAEDLGEEPVILLDDVLSELDAERQHYLLELSSRRQVFITGCEDTVFQGIDAPLFRMDQGALV